ncbi:MAG: hypothetical protein FWF06_05035, partial [Symbiobacteriaceae bacterium]|nr:hypothetical protein [Symbiobacteriaceae bacterium]
MTIPEEFIGDGVPESENKGAPPLPGTPPAEHSSTEELAPPTDTAQKVGETEEETEIEIDEDGIAISVPVARER